LPDTNRRLIAFGLIVAICIGVAVLYAVYAAHRVASAGTPSGIRVVEDPPALRTIGAGDRALFRSTALGPGYGRLALVQLDNVSGPRYATDLRCDRVDFAAGVGVCLAADRGVFTTYRALVFDETFKVHHNVGLAGIPSRTRVAPNGRLAAVTVFVSGHSYAAGSFSTQTTLIDTHTGAVLGDLEQFDITRNARPFKAVDFNFWGVTFAADSDTFYATLGTGGELLLIRGTASGRRGVVLRSGVECPSLSPDGSRLAFKRRSTEGGRLVWRLATLDLATLEDHLVPGERRSVDDQVEWLDPTHLVYALADEDGGLGGTSVWTVSVDEAPPMLWLRGAYSPAVVRANQPKSLR